MIFIVMGLAFVIVAVFMLVFFKKIFGRMYESNGLTEREINHYQNSVPKILGVIFIITGPLFIIMGIGEILAIDIVKRSFELYAKSIETGIASIVGGSILVLFGLITLALRFVTRSGKHFIKLDQFKRRYGDATGTMVHVIVYSVLPIIVGCVLLFVGLKIYFEF